MSIKKKLLDIVRDKIRFKHYSMSTEKTYTFWIKHYIFFHNKKHPVEMGKDEIEGFLTHLATQKKSAPQRRIKPLMPYYFSIKKCWESMLVSGTFKLYEHRKENIYLWF